MAIQNPLTKKCVVGQHPLRTPSSAQLEQRSERHRLELWRSRTVRSMHGCAAGYWNRKHGTRTRSRSQRDGIANRRKCSYRYHWKTWTGQSKTLGFELLVASGGCPGQACRLAQSTVRRQYGRHWYEGAWPECDSEAHGVRFDQQSQGTRGRAGGLNGHRHIHIFAVQGRTHCKPS